MQPYLDQVKAVAQQYLEGAIGADEMADRVCVILFPISPLDQSQAEQARDERA